MISSILTLIVPGNNIFFRIKNLNSNFRIFSLVTLGRSVLYLLTDHKKLNELYTIVTGLYTIWLSIRLSTIIYNWVQIGVYQLYLKFKQKIVMVSFIISFIFYILSLIN